MVHKIISSVVYLNYNIVCFCCYIGNINVNIKLKINRMSSTNKWKSLLIAIAEILDHQVCRYFG